MRGSKLPAGQVASGNQVKPDVNNAEYIIYLGTSPGHSGSPFQSLARQITEGATHGKLKFVVVDPLMNGGALGPLGGRGKWVPIKPATDGAFGLAMIRWIIENNRHNISYLSSPNLAVAKKRGFNSWTNACHLVIDDPTHPNNRKLLIAEDLGLPTPPYEPDPKQATPTKQPDYITIDKVSNKPAIYIDSQEGDLTFQGEVYRGQWQNCKG